MQAMMAQSAEMLPATEPYADPSLEPLKTGHLDKYHAQYHGQLGSWHNRAGQLHCMLGLVPGLIAQLSSNYVTALLFQAWTAISASECTVHQSYN